MLMKLTVNGHASRIASVADLRRNLAPFASEQFREIWLRMDAGGIPVHVVGNDLMQTLEHDVVYTSASSLKGGPILGALMNTNVGWLTYLRHDDGDTGFSSRNPMYNESDTLGGLAFDGLYGREHVPVITYRLSNGQEDEFPASWALPESDIMRALEYFVQHECRRSPFVQWHDDAVAEPSHEITQPKEKGEFKVVLHTPA